MLDAAEYLHLAIDASQKGDHHAALNYLNQALENEPANAGLIYFQAAEHAELGLFERACAGMTKALEIDGRIDIARFQLGLLHLKLQRPDDARETFSTLVSLTQDDSLRTFGEAYINLLDDDLAGARTKLEAGLVNCNNPALKADMARILANLTQEASEDTAVPSVDDPAPVFLGAYRDANENA
ncbi:MAG: tetratricopeptide repeat protein [Pseudomonadota bacterium]